MFRCLFKGVKSRNYWGRVKTGVIDILVGFIVMVNEDRLEMTHLIRNILFLLFEHRSQQILCAFHMF